MSDAQRLNAAIRSHAPAAAARLSALGKRIWFPNGVPAQAADARDCSINATIGQLTNGRGGSVPLDALRRYTGELPTEEVFFYAPQGGISELRAAWRERICAREETRASLPIVTCGLTHGLSLLADLFIDNDTDVLLPVPCWGNYRLILGTRRQGRLRPYSVIHDQQFNVEGLRATLATCTKPSVLVLNVPSNPVGYTPTLEEADAIFEVIEDTPVPLVVICDDAYHGMVWEDGLLPHSLFHRLSHLDPTRVLAAKVDGATKELFFFGGRVGFVTFGADGEGAAALERKMLGLARSSVSTAASPSQNMVLRALRDPATRTDTARVLDAMARRYRLLKDGLLAHEIPHLPFNSAFFALIKVRGNPDDVRHALIRDGVGVVSAPDANAVRVSYASVADHQIGALVETLARHTR